MTMQTPNYNETFFKKFHDDQFDPRTTNKKIQNVITNNNFDQESKI